MKMDKDKMQEEFSTKSSTMNGLIDHMIIQNFLEDQYYFIEPEPIIINKNQDEGINELKSFIDKDISRYEAIKTLNTAYKEEAATAINKVKLIDIEINKIKAAHNTAKNHLEYTIGSREKTILQETQQIKEEFESYKLKITQELRVRQLLEYRQQQFINDLYQELKNAKTILQNPTLRLKTYEKLRESLTPVSNEHLLPKVVQSQLSTKEGDSRNLYSPYGFLSSRSTKSNRRAKSSFKG